MSDYTPLETDLINTIVKERGIHKMIQDFDTAAVDLMFLMGENRFGERGLETSQGQFAAKAICKKFVKSMAAYAPQIQQEKGTIADLRRRALQAIGEYIPDKIDEYLDGSNEEMEEIKYPNGIPALMIYNLHIGARDVTMHFTVTNAHEATIVMMWAESQEEAYWSVNQRNRSGWQVPQQQENKPAQIQQTSEDDNPIRQSEIIALEAITTKKGDKRGYKLYRMGQDGNKASVGQVFLPSMVEWIDDNALRSTLNVGDTTSNIIPFIAHYKKGAATPQGGNYNDFVMLANDKGNSNTKRKTKVSLGDFDDDPHYELWGEDGHPNNYGDK